ncbi:MAG TPA: M1 family aminopeptidase [Frankiaceae bacterium]|nr:M1 family aminopeptidase [Frankiaceae bacterium]
MRLTFSLAADHRTVTGHERVVFTPDQPVSELVYRLWPNGRDHFLGGSLAVTNAEVAGRVVAPTWTSAGARAGTQGTLLTLPLAHRVTAGQSVTSDLDFTLKLPAPFIDRVGSNGETAWWGTAAPLLAWVNEVGWVRTSGSSTPAEMAVSEDAQLDLTVIAPAADTVLANGLSDPPVAVAADRRSWHFTSPNARDVSVAVGQFQVLAATVKTPDGPVTVRIGKSPKLDLSNRQVLEQVAHALPLLVRHFGPFPFSSLTLVSLPDLGGTGIEYPGMTFLGQDADQSVTTHELAHMWFYGLVGDDQELHPWMDEAFATAAEQIVDDELYGGTATVDGSATGGADPRPVDLPVSAFEHDLPGYDTVVYFKGADALIASRQASGAATFDAALRCYVNANAWKVAYPADFARAMSKLPRAMAILRQAGAIH